MPSPRVERPWGWYEVLDARPGSLVKRIHVRPGHQLSLQRHACRAERWVVVAGAATVQIGEARLELAAGGMCAIAPGQVHRLGNPGGGPLEVVEVQLGDPLSEDDIERLEDGYGRT